jgi:hypothetical protein
MELLLESGLLRRVRILRRLIPPANSESTDPRPAHTTHLSYASVTNTDEVPELWISSVCKHALAQPQAPGAVRWEERQPTRWVAYTEQCSR